MYVHTSHTETDPAARGGIAASLFFSHRITMWAGWDAACLAIHLYRPVSTTPAAARRDQRDHDDIFNIQHRQANSTYAYVFVAFSSCASSRNFLYAQATPHSPDAVAAAHGGDAANGADGGADQRVFLQSTRHVARAWAVYGSLLPVFKSTADVPVQLTKAVQSLFEEFMLWTVVTFAGVTAAGVVRGVNGKDDRFFRVVWSLMLRSDRASRTRRYGQQLQAAVQAADGKGGDAAKAVPAGSMRLAELQDGVGLGGGTLDRLVRGTIACDALATLAQDLLELEPIMVRSCSACEWLPPRSRTDCADGLCSTVAPWLRYGMHSQASRTDRRRCRGAGGRRHLTAASKRGS